MHVIDDLRKPLAPVKLGDVPSLLQIEHEPIAIVVVTGVMVIELRRNRAFGFRSKCLSIPIRDEIDAVGIRRWNQNENRVLQNLFRISIGRSREFVCEIHRHLRGDNLIRVNRT